MLLPTLSTRTLGSTATNTTSNSSFHCDDEQEDHSDVVEVILVPDKEDMFLPPTVVVGGTTPTCEHDPSTKTPAVSETKTTTTTTTTTKTLGTSDIAHSRHGEEPSRTTLNRRARMVPPICLRYLMEWKYSVKLIFYRVRITYLLVFGPLALLGHSMGVMGEPLCFFCAGITLIPLAERLSFVTEQVAVHTNGTIGALLNATFGNAPELLISSSALRYGFYRVVQLALLGSMLTNLLFVFGLSCFVGGLQWQVQEVRITSGNASIGMLLTATSGLLLPAVLELTGQLRMDNEANDKHHHHHTDNDDATVAVDESEPSQSQLGLSRFVSIFMIITYIGYLLFQMGTHKEEFDDDEEQHLRHYEGTLRNPTAGGMAGEASKDAINQSPRYSRKHSAVGHFIPPNERSGHQKLSEKNSFCLHLYPWELPPAVHDHDEDAAHRAESIEEGLKTLQDLARRRVEEKSLNHPPFLPTLHRTPVNSADDADSSVTMDIDDEAVRHADSDEEEQMVTRRGACETARKSISLRSPSGELTPVASHRSSPLSAKKKEMKNSESSRNSSAKQLNEGGDVSSSPQDRPMSRRRGTVSGHEIVDMSPTKWQGVRRKHRESTPDVSARAPSPAAFLENLGVSLSSKRRLSDHSEKEEADGLLETPVGNRRERRALLSLTKQHGSDRTLCASDDGDDDSVDDVSLTPMGRGGAARYGISEMTTPRATSKKHGSKSENSILLYGSSIDSGPMSFRAGLLWLLLITIGISAMSDILVDTIDGFASRSHISEVFTSVVILPFFSNIAEQVSAVLFAYRNEMDLCVGVTVGSCVQVALFVLPACVLVGWAADRSMTLYFHGYETACLVVGVLAVSAVLHGGTTNWLVGLIFVNTYLMMASGFWYHELENLSVDEEELWDHSNDADDGGSWSGANATSSHGGD